MRATLSRLRDLITFKSIRDKITVGFAVFGVLIVIQILSNFASIFKTNKLIEALRRIDLRQELMLNEIKSLKREIRNLRSERQWQATPPPSVF
jgi:CHASE3 domain sensor protein